MTLRNIAFFVSAGVLGCLTSLPSSAQQVNCVREPIEVSTVRRKGVAELMPSIVFTCGGGTEQTLLTFDLEIFLSVEVANPVIGPGPNDIDAVLVVTGPPSAGVGEGKLSSPEQGTPVGKIIQGKQNPNLNRAVRFEDVPYQGISTAYTLRWLRARAISRLREGPIVTGAQFTEGINQTFFDDPPLANRPFVSFEAEHFPALQGGPGTIVITEAGNPRTFLKRFETEPGFPGIPAQDDPLAIYDTESGYLPDPSGPFSPAGSGTRLILGIDLPPGLDATVSLPACIESRTTPGFWLRAVLDPDEDFSGGTLIDDCDDPPLTMIPPDDPVGAGDFFVYEAEGDAGVTGADALDSFAIPVSADCPNGPVEGMVEVKGFLGPLEGGSPGGVPLSEAGRDQLIGVLPLFVFLLDPISVIIPPPMFCDEPQINIQVPGNGIVDGATFRSPPLQPGSIVSVFGENLMPGMPANANSVPLPTELDGTQVEVDGVPAPLFFGSNGQMNFQMLRDAEAPPLREERSVRQGSRTATIVVKHSGLESDPVQVELSDHAPGIFTADFGAGRAIAFDAVDGALAQPVGSLPGS